MSVRHVSLAVTYNGATDITKDIEADLVSFSYNDNEAGTKDDISITLRDTDQKWSGEWYPTHGDSISAAIIVDGQRLQCGTFAIDEITVSGPPRTVDISASSAPRRATGTSSKGSAPKGGAINEKRTKYFENSTLEDIAKNVCDSCGLKLKYLPKSKPFFKWAQQRDETGYAFVKRIAWSRGFGVKTTPSTLIILEHKSVDSGEYMPSPEPIDLSVNDVMTWSFASTTAQQVQTVEVRYYDPKARKTYVEKATDDSVTSGIVMRISGDVDSKESAQELAKAHLRTANVKSATGSITIPGRVDLVAGVAIQIHGFAAFDGKYTAKKVGHQVSGGYVCTVELEKAIEKF